MGVFSACVSVCYICAWCLWRPAPGVRPLGTEATGGLWATMWVLNTKAWFLLKSSSCSSPVSHIASPLECFHCDLKSASPGIHRSVCFCCVWVSFNGILPLRVVFFFFFNLEEFFTFSEFLVIILDLSYFEWPFHLSTL